MDLSSKLKSTTLIISWSIFSFNLRLVKPMALKSIPTKRERKRTYEERPRQRRLTFSAAMPGKRS